MKNGFALITCLAVVIVVAIGTAGILQAVGSHANMKANTLQEVQAKYLAEAGMEYAFWKCRTVNGGCADNLTYSIDGTTVAIDVTSLGGGSYTIQTAVDYVNQ
jgi:Tfp pilus assembly protein PilX